MTRFQKLAVSTTAATFALIAAGGLVRATGSGDACPTWPGCYPGRFLPLWEPSAMIEWSHRTLVIVVTLLIGALAFAAFRAHRSRKAIWIPAVAALGIVFVQAGIGAVRIVNPDARAVIVTLHLATAMILIGSLLATTINAFLQPRSDDGEYAQLARVTAAATFILILIGAYVRGLGAGPAFPDWPLMGGRILPEAGRLQTPHFVHRLLALIVGMLIVALAVKARPSKDRAIKAFAYGAAALYILQVIAGALNVWTDLSAAAVVAHVTLSALVWGATLGLALVSGAKAARQPSDEAVPKPGAKAVVTAYVRLTKPRIIVLLLITTVPAMIVAKGGWPGLGLVVATLIGGSLAAGGANAINCFIDRDIDAKMGRTALRPIPAGAVKPARALEFGIALGIVAFAYLWAVVNLLSAALAIFALLFYVFVYTIGLKRSTPQNIVIGGAAGAVPALVGWSAVTGTLTLAPVMMFLIIFFWTPPHFWALSLRFSKDYARAGVPMLPVVAGARETHKQILVYSVVLVAVTVAFHPIGRMGALYLATSLGLGAWFIRMAVALWRSGTDKAAMALFKYSINYLALLFAGMAADTLL